MSYFESSKLKIPRRICSCAKCGTQDLVILSEDDWGKEVYGIEHNGYCKDAYWLTEGHKTVNSAIEKWNNMNEEWLDGFDLVWFEVDRVYETRWDCLIKPEGVRCAA